VEEQSFSADDITFIWLTGLLEGEGSFLRPSPSNPRESKIDVEMRDEPVIAKVAALFGVKYRLRNRHRPNQNITFHVRLSGKRAVRLMWRMRPFLCPRRQAQVDRAMQVYFEREEEGLHPDKLPRYEMESVCFAPMCIKEPEEHSIYCTEHGQVQVP
jgi:hypothetical protein